MPAVVSRCCFSSRSDCLVAHPRSVSLISDNRISDDEATSLAEALKSNSTLHSIILSGVCHIRMTHFKAALLTSMLLSRVQQIRLATTGQSRLPKHSSVTRPCDRSICIVRSAFRERILGCGSFLDFLFDCSESNWRRRSCIRRRCTQEQHYSFVDQSAMYVSTRCWIVTVTLTNLGWLADPSQ